MVKFTQDTLFLTIFALLNRLRIKNLLFFILGIVLHRVCRDPRVLSPRVVPRAAIRRETRVRVVPGRFALHNDTRRGPFPQRAGYHPGRAALQNGGDCRAAHSRLYPVALKPRRTGPAHFSSHFATLVDQRRPRKRQLHRTLSP